MVEGYDGVTPNPELLYLNSPSYKFGVVRRGFYIQEECTLYLSKVGLSEFLELNKVIVEVSNFRSQSGFMVEVVYVHSDFHTK